MLPRPLAFLSLCALGLLQGAPALAQGGPAAVAVETVETRPLAEEAPIFAEIVTRRDGTVASRIGGLVREVRVVTGDAVERGEVLARLDTELLEIVLRQREAQLAEAEAGVELGRTARDLARRAFERADGLRATASFSPRLLDDAEGDLSRTRGELAQAEARRRLVEAQMQEARYNLDRAEIEAPFSGVVLEVEANPGEFLQSGAPVARLLDTQALEVEASVPVRYVDVLEPGMEVAGTTETGEALTLTVRAVLPVEETATRTRPVRLAGESLSGSGSAAVGQSITVRVPRAAPRDILSVPKDALVQAQGGWSVFVEEDGAAQPRTVEIGTAVGDRFEVLGGLSEGDVVVVRGNERLRPGQPIRSGGPGAGSAAPASN